jgi:preprotein translocase SecF subunit
MEVSAIRDILSGIGMGESEIKSYGEKDDFIIYIPQQKGVSASDMARRVEETLTDKIPDNPYQILAVDTVGPKIGEELRKSAVWAVVLSLLLILIYLAYRFEFVFAVGAVVALFHDVAIVFGIFVLFDYELSLKEIAAFLTLIGYSLNDTIVVYDRIREDLKLYRTENLETIMNRSVNETLSRTFITGTTTFAVVLILFFLGGEVIKGFAFTMVIGLIVGTYSSVFVASPLVLEWQNRHGGVQALKMVKKRK